VAMVRFFGSDFAAAGSTTVLVPKRSSGMWVRCTSCGTMTKGRGSAVVGSSYLSTLHTVSVRSLLEPGHAQSGEFHKNLFIDS